MEDERKCLEQTTRELLTVNSALVEEVRGLRQIVEAAIERRRKLRVRVVVVLLVTYFGLPLLAIGSLSVMNLFRGPREESPYERQQRQQQEQLDRTDRALERAEKLIGRWEKSVPRELESVQEEFPGYSGCMSQIYPSDLTDAQWDILKPLVPPDRSGGRPRQVNIRRVIDAILYLNRTGCQWRLLPHDFPKWKLVAYYFYKWRDEGIWTRIHDALLAPTRQKAGRAHDTPSAGSVDSSTVKATEGTDRGFDGAKWVKGRKRHKVVDTLGLLLAVVVTGAQVDDAKAVPDLFRQLSADKYPRLMLLWADNKYRNHELNAWLQHTYEGPIRIEVTSRTDADTEKKKIFKPIKWRWVIERTNAWVKRARRNAMDHEHTASSSETMVRIAMIKIMLNRLTGTKPEFPFRYPRPPKVA